jgi:uncharacterized membrane protein YtjA (UPF0391 family)
VKIRRLANLSALPGNRPFNLAFSQHTFRSLIKEHAMGNMLYYAIVFLVVALVAAFLGFGGVAGTAMEGARLLFWVAIILFVVSLIAGIIRKA